MADLLRSLLRDALKIEPQRGHSEHEDSSLISEGGAFHGGLSFVSSVLETQKTEAFKMKLWTLAGPHACIVSFNAKVPFNGTHARRSTRKPIVEAAPEFAREALSHSVAPPDAYADAEVSKGAPTTKNLLRPPRSGKSRWRSVQFPVGEVGAGYRRRELKKDYNSDPFSDGIPNNISHTDNVPSAVLQNVSTSKDMSTSGFTSPPLMPGLLSCLKDVLRPNAKPTPIQALSLQHLFSDDDKTYKEYLLASGTGSGKSIAYLLPLLQSLQQSELDGSVNRQRTHALNPRALILAPTHELARQLATFAKSLIREIKLRVLCASRANTGHKVDTFGGSARPMKGKLEALFGGKELTSELKDLLEMVKGRGWDRRVGEEEKPEPPVESEGEEKRKFRKGRDIALPTTGKTGTSPAELGLINVDWVVIDEADVLFETQPKPIFYPFNLVLTSATIPSALSNYLDIHHPSHTRVASPILHHLPASLQTEYVGWTGGNKLADIEKRIRRVWSEDSITRTGTLSEALVFCNKNIKVKMLSEHLKEKGINTIAIDGSPGSHAKGSNRHLNGFLRKPLNAEVGEKETNAENDLEKVPHVLITTSLLSRGIDFSPQIKHVFIVDEPRNIDFLNRAGRSGRSGQTGEVVVFGKLEGRGSSRAEEVRKRVGRLR
ncbi:P-loop containing nucleoside triphosphate hydrolase protein [Hymenopellis radicata]|nr:P-loop containing nucleoside triphosphate hydrolase protein [Hymenopellis radicata]